MVLQVCYSAILNVWWHCSTIVNQNNIFYSFHLLLSLPFQLLSLSLSGHHFLSFSLMPLLMTLSLPMPLTSHCPFIHFLINPSLTMWLWACKLDFLGEISEVKDLVVVVAARSVWFWVCKSVLVVGGNGFANQFWLWAWGWILVVALVFGGFEAKDWKDWVGGPWVVVAWWVWGWVLMVALVFGGFAWWVYLVFLAMALWCGGYCVVDGGSMGGGVVDMD